MIDDDDGTNRSIIVIIGHVNAPAAAALAASTPRRNPRLFVFHVDVVAVTVVLALALLDNGPSDTEDVVRGGAPSWTVALRDIVSEVFFEVTHSVLQDSLN